MIMPDRMLDAAQTRENHTLFEALARQLLEEGIVSRIAPSTRRALRSTYCLRRAGRDRSVEH